MIYDVHAAMPSKRMTWCPTCGGNGYTPDAQACPRCEGLMWIEIVPCPACQGRRTVWVLDGVLDGGFSQHPESCRTCEGKGWVFAEEAIAAAIPCNIEF